MTLGFSTKWPAHMDELASQPNYFIHKIWMSLNIQQKQKEYEYYYDLHVYELSKVWDICDEPIKPKLHTIREGDRWKAGMYIHPVINNRTSNRFQFAPRLICTSVQEIEVFHCKHHGQYYGLNVGSWIRVENFILPDHLVKTLAINDGFETVEHFFAYFNQDFKGQIIHWTDLKY